MKNRILLIIIAVAAQFAAATAQSNAAGDKAKLQALFKNIALYDSRCTQEKAYLHLDNNAYFIGETMYFKAYVVRASSLKYTDLSKVLYVELLDDHGNTIERRNYEIQDGQASGNIPLNSLIHGGYYEVRAFTRAMLNWDSEYCFSRVVPVYETNDTTGRYSDAYLYAKQGQDQLPMMREEPSTLRSDSVRHGDGLYVEFYPEGGALVEGMQQKVAYRVTDKQGNPINYAELKVSDGGKETTSKTQHEGMGEFTVASAHAGIAVAVSAGDKSATLTLPAPRKSGVAATLSRGGGKAHISLAYTPDLEGKLLGLSVTCRGAACKFDTLRLAGGKAEWEMDETALHYGVNQITIFNDEGQILWERLTWRQPDYPVSLEVRQNEETYSAFAPVVLDMKLADRKGNPCNAYFSLSVYDRATEMAGRDVSLAQDLLLSSDLRGYISHPEYYFEADDDVHHTWLDLLLLVQGWRRYDWLEMSGKKPFELRQPVEDGQLITGQLLRRSGKVFSDGKPSLKLNVFLPGLHIEGEAPADSIGRFALMPPKYYGEGVGRFTTFLDGKPKTMRVKLDRSFAPKPRMIDVQEISFSKRIHAPEVPARDTFQWDDTISKGDILLKEAVVKGKRKNVSSYARDNWNGGESFAIRNADICYNVEMESIKYCDQGYEDPLVWDLLKSINKNFDYFTGDAATAGIHYEFTYRGRPAVVFRRNTEQDQGRINDLTLMASEVSRIYIITDQERVRRVLPEYGSNSNFITAIFLYGDGNAMELKHKAKTKVVRFYGYDGDIDFPSPDYRKRDLPNPKDFRRTLYWNSDVLADENGHATVTFYTNANKQVKLGITARSVLPDGELVDFER